MQKIKIGKEAVNYLISTTALDVTAKKFEITLIDVSTEVGQMNLEVIKQLLYQSVKAAGGKFTLKQVSDALEDPANFMAVWKDVVSDLGNIVKVLAPVVEKK